MSLTLWKSKSLKPSPSRHRKFEKTLIFCLGFSVLDCVDPEAGRRFSFKLAYRAGSGPPHACKLAGRPRLSVCSQRKKRCLHSGQSILTRVRFDWPLCGNRFSLREHIEKCWRPANLQACGGSRARSVGEFERKSPSSFIVYTIEN